MSRLASLIIFAAVGACGNSQAGTSASPSAAKAAMLPDRLLSCTLGRAKNIDPARHQTTGDIEYEGAHRFELFLPSIPVHQGPLPDPTDPAEPVDPRTQIVSDTSGLTRGVPPGFDRVADLWPERVELMRITGPIESNLIVISEIDEKAGRANLFMTKAADAATLDWKNVYSGGCTISNGTNQVAAK